MRKKRERKKERRDLFFFSVLFLSFPFVSFSILLLQERRCLVSPYIREKFALPFL